MITAVAVLIRAELATRPWEPGVDKASSLCTWHGIQATGDHGITGTNHSLILPRHNHRRKTVTVMQSPPTNCDKYPCKNLSCFWSLLSARAHYVLIHATINLRLRLHFHHFYNSGSVSSFPPPSFTRI